MDDNAAERTRAEYRRRAIYAEFEALKEQRRAAAAAGDVLRVLEIRARTGELTAQLRRMAMEQQ